MPHTVSPVQCKQTKTRRCNTFISKFVVSPPPPPPMVCTKRMNCQINRALRAFTMWVCAQTASHMEDTWSYITAFIGHNERVVRGLCQDILFIFLTLEASLPPSFFSPPPSLSVCTVMTWSCLLTLPQDSLNDPIRKRKYNKASVAVVCSCLGLWLSPPRPGSAGL